jgi:hypothetical protein
VLRRIIPILVIFFLIVVGGLSYAYRMQSVPRAQASRAGVAVPARVASATPAHDKKSTPTHGTATPTPRTKTGASGRHTATHATSTARTATPTARATATRTARPTPVPPTKTATPIVPLQLGDARFSLFTINPRFTRQNVSFTLSTAAHVSVRIAAPGDIHHVRTMDLGQQPAGTVNLSWDGRDNAHRLVPEGSYTYTIVATAAHGQRQTESYNMLGVTYKRILISLSKQQLWAFDGFHYVLSSLVTTGNPALPTPTGNFPILGKYSPFTFVSPWPPGSKYYYAPSYTNYALLFDNRGYYVHDAPWRTDYGPGTNTTVGTPGQNYTGSHGCVNVPYAAEQQLFAWATIGTIVQVVA